MKFARFKGQNLKGKGKLLVLLCVFVFTGFFSRTVFAFEPLAIFESLRDLLTGDMSIKQRICNPTKVIYRNIMEDQKQSSIVRTHYFITAAGPLNLIYNLTGMSIDRIPRCTPVIGNYIDAWCKSTNPVEFWGEVIKNIGPWSDDTKCPFVLDLLTHEYKQRPPGEGSFANSATSSSLVGLVSTLQSSSIHDAPPVSLAYFAEDTASRIPFVSKALAKDPDAGTYKGILLEEILVAWKVTRNISLGFMSLFMLYMGILIIMRKNLDQRTVVTVQYALPKVALAIFLIVFSYPIGAALANFGWVMGTQARTIVKSAFEIASGGALDTWVYAAITHPLGMVGIMFIAGLITGAASMGTGLIIFMIVTAVLLILLILIEIKIILIYFKMVFSIISAPLEFLYASIPGNDDKMGAWFKKMFAYIASIFSIKAVMTITNYIGASFIAAGLDAPTLGEARGDFLLAILLYPLVLIVGYIMAFTIPKKVELAITGAKPAKK